jgi:hypothetical protein
MQAVRDEPRVDERVCRGTWLSRQQYLSDIHHRGHLDARRIEHGGNLTDDDIQRWTAAIDTAR